MRTRLSLSLATLAVAMATVAYPAAAAEATGPGILCEAPDKFATAEAKSDRADTVAAIIVDTFKNGGDDADVLRRLRAIGVVSPSGKSEETAISPLSDQSIINVAPPQILFDSCARIWAAYARWDFNNISALGAELGFTPTCGACDLGGDDAFGITFNRRVTSVTGYRVETWGKNSHYPPSTSRMFPVDANTDGVAFRGQDIYCKQNAATTCGTGDYNFYHGVLTYSIGSIGCGTLQAFSKYGHSWTSTELNGISVGPWSIGLQWSSSSNRWEKASQPSNAVTPC